MSNNYLYFYTIEKWLFCLLGCLRLYALLCLIFYLHFCFLFYPCLFYYFVSYFLLFSFLIYSLSSSPSIYQIVTIFFFEYFRNNFQISLFCIVVMTYSVFCTLFSLIAAYFCICFCNQHFFLFYTEIYQR